MTRLRHGLAAGLLFFAAARAEGNWRGAIPTRTNSGIVITVSSPISASPAEGFIPCWISIGNESGAAHVWEVTLSSENSYGSGGNRTESAVTIRVAQGETARAPLLLPLLLSNPGYYRRNLISVEGYAIGTPNAAQFPSGSYPRNPRTAYIAMSETLATPLWEPLKKAFSDVKQELAGSPTETGLLPTDWRGFAGFDCLWLTGAEYLELDPARKLAIRHWVERGGVLYLCTPALDPAVSASFGPPVGDGEWRPGFGRVHLVARDEKTLGVDEAMPLVNQLGRAGREGDWTDSADWGMTHSVGAIAINAVFLILFIAVFAAVAGPVNLFWLADARRRHRLFWTTPLISVAASLLLMLVITVQDGFGGRGERLMFTRLFPDGKKALVYQEQVSRTGVLLSRGFTLPEDIILSGVGGRRFTGKSLEQAGRGYRGDWFASRSVQAQRLEAVAPSRAEVQLVNAAAAEAGAAPAVISSLPATLREIEYLDAASHMWRGAGLRTGERVTLQAATGASPPNAQDGSAWLVEMQRETRRLPGYFYAIADDAPFLPTLPSIRWTKQRAVYAGPVTIAR